MNINRKTQKLQPSRALDHMDKKRAKAKRQGKMAAVVIHCTLRGLLIGCTPLC